MFAPVTPIDGSVCTLSPWRKAKSILKHPMCEDSFAATSFSTALRPNRKWLGQKFHLAEKNVKG